MPCDIELHWGSRLKELRALVVVFATPKCVQMKEHMRNLILKAVLTKFTISTKHHEHFQRGNVSVVIYCNYCNYLHLHSEQGIGPVHLRIPSQKTLLSFQNFVSLKQAFGHCIVFFFTRQQREEIHCSHFPLFSTIRAQSLYLSEGAHCIGTDRQPQSQDSFSSHRLRWTLDALNPCLP